MNPRNLLTEKRSGTGQKPRMNRFYGYYGIHLTTVITPQVPVLLFLVELTPVNNKDLQILEENLKKIPQEVEPSWSWFFGKAYTETLVLTAVWAYQVFTAYSLYHHYLFKEFKRSNPFLIDYERTKISYIPHLF